MGCTAVASRGVIPSVVCSGRSEDLVHRAGRAMIAGNIEADPPEPSDDVAAGCVEDIDIAAVWRTD